MISAIVAGVFGLLVGSFLNVVIYRVPAGKSIVSPPSTCPRCGARIRWYDNIPVVSWLVLRGKCRDCGSSISLRYPLVELGTGVLFTVVGLGFPVGEVSTGPTVGAGFGFAASIVALLAFLYLAAVSVALAMIDLDTSTLPNKLVLPVYPVGVLLLGSASVLSGEYWPLAQAGIGMVALLLLYLLLAIVKPGGMGMGDVKLAGALGLFLGWLGWSTLLVGAFSAFIFGGLFAIALLLLGKTGRKSRIPFGPWMLLGAWVGTLAGDEIAGWYLGLFGLA